MPQRILVADDDPIIRDTLLIVLQSMNFQTSSTKNAKETIQAVRNENWDVILLDLKFPDCEDLSTLRTIKEISPATDVLLVTAETDDLQIVSDAIHLGAFDYVPKPVREDDIKIRLTRVIEMRRLYQFRTRAVDELAKGQQFSDIIGVSDEIKLILHQASQLANYDIPVLICGETGTGKELVARALHHGGARRDDFFVALNCAALPQSLIESELFGHEKGSFTGAHNKREGAFAEAENGTLFLDEIGDMDMSVQASLLRVLEQGEYRSVGGVMKKTNARIVFATNQDLMELIQAGQFRKDLYYRINRFQLNLPPLRNRRNDIAHLAKHFLNSMDSKIGKRITGISPEAEAALANYDWPGNIRELRNEIERAYILTNENEIQLLDLSSEIINMSARVESAEVTDSQSLAELQRLIEVFRMSGENISKTAKILGVHRNTVHRWLKKYSLLKSNQLSS